MQIPINKLYSQYIKGNSLLPPAGIYVNPQLPHTSLLQARFLTNSGYGIAA